MNYKENKVIEISAEELAKRNTPEEVEDRIRDMGDEAMNRYTSQQEPPEGDDGGDDE